MINLSKFERNNEIFNKVSEQTKLTKWINIDPESPCANSEELLAIFDNNTLIGYIHIEDVTEDWQHYEGQKHFGITKFFIFPQFQNQQYGKEAALTLFDKQHREGYTHIIMQVEHRVALFWEKVIETQETFPKENIHQVYL